MPECGKNPKDGDHLRPALIHAKSANTTLCRIIAAVYAAV
jgi:hypothetical protein